MSDELAAAVVSGMGPGEVDDLLIEALGVLRERYGAAFSRSVSITFSWCESRGRPSARRMDWRVEVDNETGFGHSRLEALQELRQHIEATAVVPACAQRVADILREVNDDHWTLDRVMRGARDILDEERRSRR